MTALESPAAAPGPTVADLSLLADGAQEALARLTAAALRLLAVPQAVVTFVEDDALVVVRADGTAGIYVTGERFGFGHSFCHLAIEHGAPMAVPDATSDPRTLALPAVRARGIAAGLAAPLRVGGAVVGAVSAFATAPRRWGDGDVATLEVLAAAAAAELELRSAVRSERSAHAAATAFATLAEHSPDAICRVDRALRYVYVNPAFAGVVGLARERLVGAELGEIGVLSGLADVSAGWIADVRQALEAGRAVDSHHAVRRAGDASTRHFETRCTPELDADGAVRSVLVSARDVTARYEALERLRVSEERFRSLVEAAPVGIGQVGLDGRWLDASPRLLAMLGYSLEELRARRTADITYAGDPMLVTTRVTGDFAPEAGALEKRYVRGDGAALWVRVTAALVRDARGAPAHYIAAVEDITARREAEAALAASEERFRALVEHATELIAIVDERGIVRYASPSHAVLLGRSEGELHGCDAFDLMHPDDRERATACFAEVLRTGASAPDVPVRVRHRDGTWRVFAVRGTDMRHAPAVRGVVINAHDVTEQRQLQAQLAQAQKMEALGQLAGGVAHDFNNILASIATYAELLRDDLPGDDPRAEDVAEILRASARGAAVTRQLLAFSRRQALETETLDLVQVVQGMSRMLRSLLPAEIAVELPPPETPPVLVRATRAQLEQVLLNLAVNARDAMPEGGTLTVRVRARVGDLPAVARAHALLEVADTGVGMSESVRAHMFEPFFTTKPAGRGTGLGLATVYGLVQQFGGEIAVTTAEGRGTTFTLAFPLVEAGDGAPAPPDAATTGDGAQRCVLVVEDEPQLRAAARRVLERGGYRVDDAPHGVAALALLRGGARVDVVLSDVAMPELGGRALALQLAAERPSLPVVLMSGYAELSLGTDGAPAGEGGARHGPPNVVAFVEKPFTADRLLRAIALALRGGAAAR